MYFLIQVSERDTSDLLHVSIMWVLILLNGWFPASNEKVEPHAIISRHGN